MKNMSVALLNFLNSASQFVMIDLFSIAMKNGVTLRYCTAGVAMDFGGYTWLAAPAGLTRSKVRWVTGIEVDVMDVVFQADASITINGVPMLAAAVLGMFDNARLTLARLYMSDWSTPVDAVNLFAGNITNVEVLRSALHLSVASDLDGLNVQMPLNLYQASCMHTLYDIGCSVNVNTYSANGTVTGLGADGGIHTGLTHAPTWFQMGAIKFTSGLNVGLTRTVRAFGADPSYSGATTGAGNGTVYPSNPFPFDIAEGDGFVITPGCDKLRSGDCTKKYNNAINFRGFEYIPVPETAA